MRGLPNRKLAQSLRTPIAHVVKPLRQFQLTCGQRAGGVPDFTQHRGSVSGSFKNLAEAENFLPISNRCDFLLSRAPCFQAVCDRGSKCCSAARITVG
jgi:hypothetical protein